MATERSVVFVKHPHINKSAEIFDYFDEWLSPSVRDFQRTRSKDVFIPQPVMAVHYAHVKEKYPDAYADYMRTFADFPVVGRIYLGEDGLCSAIRKLVGVTDPAKAECGTIRNTFSNDSLARAIAEKRAVDSVVHASDSPENGEIETRRFAPFFSFRANGELIFIPFSQQKYLAA